LTVAIYMLILATLGQFCESKAVKKNSMKYKLYSLILTPITLPFKLCGIDMKEKISYHVNALSNGRTYVVTVFYFIIYIASFVLCIITLIKPLDCLFPQQSEEDETEIFWSLI